MPIFQSFSDTQIKNLDVLNNGLKLNCRMDTTCSYASCMGYVEGKCSQQLNSKLMALARVVHNSSLLFYTSVLVLLLLLLLFKPNNKGIYCLVLKLNLENAKYKFIYAWQGNGKIKRSTATNKTCNRKKDDDLPVQDHLHQNHCNQCYCEPYMLYL